jgi:hypothetical protein
MLQLLTELPPLVFIDVVRFDEPLLDQRKLFVGNINGYYVSLIRD